MPSWTVWLTTALVAILTSLFAVLSALLERSGPIRLRHWAQGAGASLASLYGHPDRFEAFRLVLSVASRLGLLVTVIVAWELGSGLWLVAVCVALSLLAGELGSRMAVAQDPEEALQRLTPLYRVVLVLARPLMWLVRPLVPRGALERRPDEGEPDEGEIEAFLDVGQREGILEPGEEELVKGVVEFGDTLVKSAMTPRTEVDAAPETTGLADLLDLFMESSRTRIPLYSDSLDHVTGVLHLRDLLDGLRGEDAATATGLAMEPFVVPETKPISELLREFQARRQQLAIVVDEFGGLAGVVTVEDLLEEIVGEIADEHEADDVPRLRLAENVWQLDGACEVEDLEELFGLDLDSEGTPYETVGGLVFTSLGYLPEPGERLVAHGLAFEVVRVEGRRIRTVRIEPVVNGDRGSE